MRKVLPAALAIIIGISSCSKDEENQQPSAPQITITFPDGGFKVDSRQWLRVQPVVTGDSATTRFLWTLNNDTVSVDKNLLYVFAEGGTYNLEFSASNNAGTTKQQVVVTVAEKSYENSILTVFDYSPAPGQFINSMPAWEQGNTAAQVIAKAQESLNNRGMISLGGFGGYVVLGLGHTIINKPDDYSFLVKGNAFDNWSEPGIVMVSADVNGNGLPDDEWYEIAGAEYNSPETIHDYQITYYKPDEGKTPMPDGMYLSDTTYLRWKDNQGKSGYVSKNVFHAGSYYPQWKGDSISFAGTCLTNKHVGDISGEGSMFVSLPFAWGYTDNVKDDAENAAIRISWAVDKSGKTVHLPGIDFIRVHTGMRAEAGWLGEVSTEVTGLVDLNLK
ncbi:PKD-like domain-containing protein [Chitinophaga rhizophila]|uniref:PKD domain-containing protein n=1 Tax=Chitinophaga rhizophila TaxID=2866212 RepID=A0ABS7G6S2_9BACT|nr:PKD-like domain-containing protein [Chitinophaga rhizophila]MBW8683347.1 hypothetical protein [Chitinophaga rhizophila]